MADPPRNRLKRREDCGYRFLTFSTYRRLPLLVNPRIRDVLVKHIVAARRKTHFSLIACVIMPEHLHIILVPAPEFPVPRVLIAFKKPFAELVLNRWRTIGATVLTRLKDASGLTHFWQRGEGLDRNVRDESELQREVGYIHHNPVKRGLVESPQEWAWSFARWYLGIQGGGLDIDLPWGRPMEEHLRREAPRQTLHTEPIGASSAGLRHDSTPAPRSIARDDDGGAMARLSASPTTPAKSDGS